MKYLFLYLQLYLKNKIKNYTFFKTVRIFLKHHNCIIPLSIFILIIQLYVIGVSKKKTVTSIKIHSETT